MSRTKQVNVSIPNDKVALIDAVTDMCQSMAISRSELITQLLSTWLDGLEGADIEEHASKDPHLPDFLN